jgi:hypothetical protein
MIDERIVAAAVERLAALAPAHWPRATAEIQEGGAFLLLSVQLASSDQVHISPATRDSIVRTLNIIIPRFPDQTLGSWLVVVMSGSDVKESILPNGA